MGFFDDTLGLGKIGDLIDDGLDFIEENVSNFFDDPFGTIGDLAEDTIKSAFGVNLFKSLAPDVPTQNPVFEDRKVTFRDSLANREIVYGRVKKGGSVVYLEASGADDEFMHLVVVLASHTCSSIDAVFFGDDFVATKLGNDVNDSQTFTVFSKWQNHLTMYAQLGGHAAAYAPITADTPANWTANHILQGHAYLYLKLKYDKDLFRRGIPQISVTLDGKKDIFDPRTSLTGYSNNHALCCLDYLRTADGLGIPDSEIDMQSFIDGANYSDQQVPKFFNAVNESRYEANGVISIDRRPLDHLEELQKAGGALVVKSQNIWNFIRSEFVAASLALDDDDLVGGLQLTPSTAKEGRLNTVKGVIIPNDPFGDPTDYPAVVIPGYVTADQEELSANIDFNFVGSPYQAQRLAKIAIEQSRFGLTVSGVYKFKAMELSVGDRLTLTNTALGISSSTFVVLDMGISFAGGISLLMREDAAAIYTSSSTDRSEVIASPAINLPNPNPIAPTGITITEELYSTNGGRDIKARAIVSWTEPLGRSQSYDVQFKPDANSAWQNVETAVFGNEARKDDLAAGTYDFRVRAINSVGWAGVWVEQNNVVFLGKTAPPPDVDSVSILDAVLDWVYSSPPLDLAGFEVRAHDGVTQDWATATKLHTGLVSASRFDVRDILTAQKTFLIKAVDTSGVFSVNSSNITTSPAVIPPINTSDLNDDANLGGTADWPTVTGAGKPADNADVTANNAANTIIVPDTRLDNELPSFYRAKGRGIYPEFKQLVAMGVTGFSTYGMLLTEVKWNDTTGGAITQKITDDADVTFTRVGSANDLSWGAWKKSFGEGALPSWAGDIDNIPVRFSDAATTGLNLTATHLGYFDGSSWQSYMDNAGQFFLNGDANNFLSWNGATLSVRGDVQATSISAGAIDGEIITGAEIQTASGSVERIELLGSDNKLRVFWDSGNAVVEENITLGFSSLTNPLPGFNFAEVIGHDNYQGSGIFVKTIGTNQFGVWSFTNAQTAINGICSSTNKERAGVVGENLSAGNGTGVLGISNSNLAEVMPELQNGAGVAGVGVTTGVVGYGTLRGMLGVAKNVIGNGVEGRGGGNAGTFDFYANGPSANYGPFTGAHEALIAKTDTFISGDIVAVIGIVGRSSLSNTIPEIKAQNSTDSKDSLGVIIGSSVMPDFVEHNVAALKNMSQVDYDKYKITHDICAVNGVGEGQINVCDEGGNIEIGDFICSSTVLGKGKQYAGSDMRVVVARAIEPADWAIEPETTKQIACIYLCG